MVGIDPLNIEAGKVIKSAWDEEEGNDSCHCAFRVEVTNTDPGPMDATRTLVTFMVIAHALQAGDKVLEIYSRGDEGNCHCDVYFLVERHM